MPADGQSPLQETDWNVLTSPWLEVVSLDAEAGVCSPLEALNRARSICSLAIASPLDLFATHRFLITLLYWKSDLAGGVEQVRESLLRGEVPKVILDSLKADAHYFRLFDKEAPYLQDASQASANRNKSAGSLFAEMSTGTNLAHFDHGDDNDARLCLSCATAGLLRLVLWTQSGGAGLTPSIHGAPPVMALAVGENLAQTLGLNLVPMAVGAGVPQWTGHFAPKRHDGGIPFLEALTWNPRRVHIGALEHGSVCWRCGRTDVAVAGPVLYAKNEETKPTKNGNKSVPFEWRDPSAFYEPDTPYITKKSSREDLAVYGRDLGWLCRQDTSAKSDVVEINPDHRDWLLIVPSTNPANNKSFDHRKVELREISPDAVRAALPSGPVETAPSGMDGWPEPLRAGNSPGAEAFVRSAASLLTDADWAALSAAAYQEMNYSPAAFDVMTGLIWPLKKKKIWPPRHNAAWLVLKLMAAVPARARAPHAKASFSPLQRLPKRQSGGRHRSGPAQSLYPVSLPRGRRLEAALRAELDKNMRQRPPQRVDWIGLCIALNQLLR